MATHVRTTYETLGLAGFLFFAAGVWGEHIFLRRMHLSGISPSPELRIDVR